MEQPWYKRTFRWAQTNFTEDDPAMCDLEFWRRQWRKTKAQGVIINCGGIVAYYPSKFPLHYRAHTLGEHDFFGEVTAMARQEGMVVVARMDVNRIAGDMAEAYPQWLCRNQDRTPITSGQRFYVCVNSGYYTDFVPKILTEIVERYHPEGFADNNWKGLDRSTICYCENCRKNFLAYSGKELPKVPNWSDPAYPTWIRWNYILRQEIWDRFNQTVQAVGGPDCLWCGMLNADIVERAQRFVDLKELLRRSKIIFSDQQGRASGGFEENSWSGTLLRMSSSENILVPESMANYTRGRRTFRLSANPTAETRLWMLAGIAGGISPWFHHVGGGQNDRRQFSTPVPVMQWHQEQEKYLYHRTDLASVGIVWSQQNADFYGRDKMRERITLPWRGFTYAMLRRRIPFLPLHADDIKAYVNRVRTLILPDIAILSESQTEAVISFAQQGGSLVLSSLTGTLDQNGTPLQESPLWKYLGLSLQEGPRGISVDQSPSWECFDAHDYISLPGKRHPIYEGFEETDLLPFGGRLCKVTSSGAMQPLCGYIPPFPIFPPEFSWIREKEPRISPIFAGSLAGGGRCIYLAGDIDRCYGKDLLPDHGMLLGNIVQWAAGDTLPLQVHGGGELDCKIYRQPGRKILHIVNITGTNRCPGYLEEYVPIHSLKIGVPVENGIKCITATVSGLHLQWEIRGQMAWTVLPQVTDHEMLVIEEI